MKMNGMIVNFVKSITTGPVFMYPICLAFAVFSITNSNHANAQTTSSSVDMLPGVLPAKTGVKAGVDFYNWMFGGPKPEGGYGQCPFRSDVDFQGSGSGFDCQNLKPTAPPPTAPPWSTPNGDNTPPSSFSNAQEPCRIYSHVLACMKGCSDVEKNRLIGYYQTCSGMTQLTMPPPPPPIYGLDRDGGDLITACSGNKNFKNYVNNMRSCLQVSLAEKLKSCETCSEVVGGIIDSHTPCNAKTNFCEMGADPQAIRCFGAALGASWQGFFGGHSTMGPIRSVGICHMLVDQVATCAASSTNLTNWWNNICSGYQTGCKMSGGSSGGGGWCAAACPMSDQLTLTGQHQLAEVLQKYVRAADVLAPAGSMALATKLCEAMLGQ